MLPKIGGLPLLEWQLILDRLLAIQLTQTVALQLHQISPTRAATCSPAHQTNNLMKVVLRLQERDK